MCDRFQVSQSQRPPHIGKSETTKPVAVRWRITFSLSKHTSDNRLCTICFNIKYSTFSPPPSSSLFVCSGIIRTTNSNYFHAQCQPTGLCKIPWVTVVQLEPLFKYVTRNSCLKVIQKYHQYGGMSVRHSCLTSIHKCIIYKVWVSIYRTCSISS